MEAIDANLLTQLRLGNTQAFTVLFERYWKLLYAIAYRRLHDEAVAQDIVQDVFMQIWDKRQKLAIHGDYIQYYLLKAVKNRIINHFAAQRTKDEVINVMMHRMQEVAHTEYQPSRFLELERLLDQQIEALPATMRAVFLLRSDNHSISVIAEKLGLAEQTVKNNLTAASHQLRGALLKKFSDEEFAGFTVAILFLTNG